jgi:hypothetical protein
MTVRCSRLSKQSAEAVWPIPKSYRYWRVVAGGLHSLGLMSNASALQALR